MSKTLSLDIKTAYQIGLVLFGLIAGSLIVINVASITQLFGKAEIQPTAKIREQQLIKAIELVRTNPLEN